MRQTSLLIYFCGHISKYYEENKKVLEEKEIKQIWLADQFAKSCNMVYGHVQNRKQPRLEVLFENAKILRVKPQDLIKENK